MIGDRSSAVVLDASREGSIPAAARILREGGVAAIPTDTLYGLSASIYRADAVDRILTIKQRPAGVALPVLIGTAADLPLLVREVPVAAWRLIDHFWPGPLTLVLPARPAVPRSITGGSNTVAVRVPGGRTVLRLLEILGEPIVGTSANMHGQDPAVTAAEVIARLSENVDAILADDAAVSGGAPSTVVEVRSDECLVHRAGAIERESIRAAIGMRVRLAR